MRNLEFADLFKMSRLITSLGMREEFREIAAVYQSDNTRSNVQFNVGYDLLFAIFEKASSVKAEAAIYEFVADLLEADPETIAKSDPIETIERLIEGIGVDKWKDFFKRVAKLIMKK